MQRLIMWLGLVVATFSMAQAQRTSKQFKPVPVAARAPDCYKRKNAFFCNHGDKSVRRPKRDFLTYGWCCPLDFAGKGDERCTAKGDVECTMPKAD